MQAWGASIKLNSIGRWSLGWALSLARSTLRPLRIGKISGIWQRQPFWLPPRARANNRETRRLLTNRPGSSFSTKSPIPTNVYASAIGLCKDSMIMQSRKPSNSDLYGPFDINLFSIPLLLSRLTEVQSWTFRGEFAVRHGSSRRILVFGGSMRPEP